MNRAASSAPKAYGASSRANRPTSSQSGRPSRRHTQAKDQRGSGSPGYHLPCPWCNRPPGAKRARSRRRRSSACRRLAGPSAVVFHSGASRSSIETNVGSPPTVSRTSPAARSRSMRSPRASMACHCSSVYGRVTRGSSWTRRTDMRKLNTSRQRSSLPVGVYPKLPLMGAALVGSAAQASGRWPSPAARPEVGSKPTQPAPGR